MKLVFCFFFCNLLEKFKKVRKVDSGERNVIVFEFYDLGDFILYFGVFIFGNILFG